MGESVQKTTPPEKQIMRQKQNQAEVIDLLDLSKFYLGHIRMIIVVLLLGATIAFAYTKFMVTPMYQATSKIYIVSASSDSVINLSDLQIGSNLTADYQQLIKSKVILKEIIDTYELNMSYSQLANCVTVNNPSNTRIITITVTFNDPVLSAGIANDLAELTKVYLPTVMKSDEPYVYEQADVPITKASPSLAKNTVLGALLLTLCYLGLLTLNYLMDDSLKDPQDVVRWMGVNPLAVIPDMSNFSRKGYGYGYGYGHKESSKDSKERKDRNK